jgi:hypothetical protein
MPTYTFECPAHGEFEVTVPISQHRDHWPCPYKSEFEAAGVKFVTAHCSERTEQTYTPERPKNWAIQAVVVHLGKDGAVRFPAHVNAPVPKGFNRVELRSLGEIEQFERRVNAKLSAEAAIHIENEERHFSILRDQSRSDLRQRMQSMSLAGKAFAQFCIEENNRCQRKSSDVGFHLNILHFNSSNREAHNDKETGWKPTRWI